MRAFLCKKQRLVVLLLTGSYYLFPFHLGFVLSSIILMVIKHGVEITLEKTTHETTTSQTMWECKGVEDIPVF